MLKRTISGARTSQNVGTRQKASPPLRFSPCIASQIVRSEKLQNESFPNFLNFRPEFCPEFCSEFSPNFSRSFRASFRGKRRPDFFFQKSPAFFNAKSPSKPAKKKSTKVFWGAGKVTNCLDIGGFDMAFFLTFKWIFPGFRPKGPCQTKKHDKTRIAKQKDHKNHYRDSNSLRRGL